MPISRLKCFQNHLVVYGLAVKWESLWRRRHCKIWWRNAKFRSHDRSTANRNALSLWNDLWLVKVSRHGLDFLKPENRAMRRSRSLVISQNTWITICWKVIMGFLPNDAKNILPHVLSAIHMNLNFVIFSSTLCLCSAEVVNTADYCACFFFRSRWSKELWRASLTCRRQPSEPRSSARNTDTSFRPSATSLCKDCLCFCMQGLSCLTQRLLSVD